MYLIFILILVISIVTSVVLHGINPTLFLLTIFDLNSVIQLSDSVQNRKESPNSPAHIAINDPPAEFLFVALIIYIIAIFNQAIAIVSIVRRHLCALVFTLIINLVVFCVSINFVKTNLFVLLLMVVLFTIAYTIMLKHAKHHEHSVVHPYSIINNHHQNYGGRNPVTIDGAIYQQQQTTQATQPPSTPAATPNDPKILAPIIYCPHYTESVC